MKSVAVSHRTKLHALPKDSDASLTGPLIPRDRLCEAQVSRQSMADRKKADKTFSNELMLTQNPMAATKPANAPMFPFMGLPRELRELVLKDAFPHNHTTISFCFECGTTHAKPMCWDDDNRRDIGKGCDLCGAKFCEGLGDPWDDNLDPYDQAGHTYPIYGVEPIQAKSSNVPAEPGFLQVARKENPKLYKEALPHHYNNITMNFEFKRGSTWPFLQVMNKLNEQDDRAQMLGHIHIVFLSPMCQHFVLDWLKIRAEVLSSDCKITLAGPPDYIDAFTARYRIAERVHAREVSWAAVEATLEDLETVVVTSKPSGPYYEDEMIDEGGEVVYDYGEVVLAKI